MKKLILAIALTLLKPAITGCAAAGPVVAAYLPKAILAVQGIMTALETIDAFVGSLMTNPRFDPELRKQYEIAKLQAFAAAHAAQVAAEKGEAAKDELAAALKEARRTLDVLTEVLLRGGLLDSSGTLRAPPEFRSDLPAVSLK